MAREAAQHTLDRVVFAGDCFAQSISDSIATSADRRRDEENEAQYLFDRESRASKEASGFCFAFRGSRETLQAGDMQYRGVLIKKSVRLSFHTHTDI